MWKTCLYSVLKITRPHGLKDYRIVVLPSQIQGVSVDILRDYTYLGVHIDN